MDYRRLDEPRLDLNDPESGFSLRFPKEGAPLDLAFDDWTNRTMRFSFFDVYLFSYCLGEEFKGIPEGEFGEIRDSEIIQAMRDDSTIAPEDPRRRSAISSSRQIDRNGVKSSHHDTS